MAQQQPIKFSTLRELTEAGSVRGVSVIGLKGGYAVSVRVGMNERTLAATGSGEPRVFSSIDSVARALRPIGVVTFDVNAGNYEPALLRPRRPDAAARLSKNSAAVQHDRWFRSQVQASLDKDKDGTARYTDHDTVFKHLMAYAESKAPAKKSSRTAKKADK